MRRDARRKNNVSKPRGSPVPDSQASEAPALAPKARREPLPALSGLRFFLAGYVLLFHFAPLFFGGSVFARNFVRAGSSAIPCFFLLSGFILTYAHVVDSDHLDQPRRQFRVARFLRIYPAYFLAFLCSAPFALVQFRHIAVTIHTFIDIGFFLLLLQTWVPGLWSYWNYPAWSLSVEAFFYVLFPLMVSLMFRPRLNYRVVLGAVWISGLIAPVAMLGTTRFDWLLSSPPMHLPEFAFGMILGNRLLTLRSARPPLLSMHDRTSAVHERACGWTVPIAAAILIACYGSGWFPKSLIDHGLFAPLIGCVIWGLARGRGWFSYLLGSKPLVYLGEISFGVYIFQFPVFTACFVLATRLRIPWNTRLTFLACCAILVCASCVSFELIEKPLRRAGMRHYFRGPPVATPPLATPAVVAAA